jgi:hypothetical protein
MKNFQIRSLTGLSFALLFIFNICLIITAVIKSDDLYVAYAILLSCAQFYLYEKFKMYRILFECDTHEYARSVKYRNADETAIKHYEINPN